MDEQTIESWRQARDAKVAPLLEPRTPAWLINEEVEEDAAEIRFDLVHRWPVVGWARNRYLYEVEVDVLHYRGSAPIASAERAQLDPEARFDLERGRRPDSAA